MRALPRVLAHLELRRLRVEQVLDALVVDLDVRHAEAPVVLVVLRRRVEEFLDGDRHHAGRAVLAHHRERLPRPRRAVPVRVVRV